MIRWLHISDLHLNSKGASTAMLRDELPLFLSEQEMRCDYVFCTGDIRTADEKPCVYTDDMADFLKTICCAVGVDTKRLYIVPGNHDIDRDLPNRVAAIKRIMYRPEWVGYYDAKSGVINETDMEGIMEGESDFITFLKKIYPPDRISQYGNPEKPHFNIETDDFNILHLDTTIAYAQGQEKTDLIVGTRALYNVVRELNPNKPTLLLTHYPFTALQQDEKKMLSIMLQKHNVRLWLAGHEHDQLLQKEHYLHSLQAGELRDERGCNATFLVGEYDEKTHYCCIKAYTWFDEGWAQYPYVDLDNKPHTERYECELTSKLEAIKPRTTVKAAEANKEYYYRLPQKVEKSLLPAIECGGAEREFDELLKETWNTDTPHVIMLADGGMGKTTLLLNYCQTTDNLVLYIPAERLAALKLTIERYCIDAVYDGDEGLFRKKLYSRDKEPGITLFVDGLNELDETNERNFILELQSLNQRLKGIRIVVTSRSDFTLRHRMSGYQSVRLHPLKDIQIKGYFTPKEWTVVQESGSLRRLLGNPMMVTVYKEICSVLDEYKDVEFLDWRLPVRNSSDLLHNYYVAQIALMLKRGVTDGEKILIASICIKEYLPFIAYYYESTHSLNYGNNSFREIMDGAMSRIQINEPDYCPIEEYFRLGHLPLVNYMVVQDMLCNELHLLYKDMAVTAFPHQIYRDYMSAQWIVQTSKDADSVDELWNSRVIPTSVITHVRWSSGRYWNGLAETVHAIGVGHADAKHLILNMFDAFPSSQEGGVANYSGLDLRDKLLPDNEYIDAKISLDQSQIDEHSLGLNAGEPRCYTNLCLSPDGAYLAAWAANSIYIYPLQAGNPPFVSQLGKKVSKMMFYGNRLLVMAGNMHVYALDGEWQYVGMIGKKGADNIKQKLKQIVISGDEMHLYYNNREMVYDMRECVILRINQGKEVCQNPVDGDDITSIIKSQALRLNSSLGEIGKSGDDNLKAISYADGRLLLTSGTEVLRVLERGKVLLKDASISGNGARAVTLSYGIFDEGRKVQLWDLDSGTKIKEILCPKEVETIHLSETGEWIMGETAEETWVYSPKTGKEKWYKEHFVSSHQGKLTTFGTCVLRRKENGGVQQWDIVTEETKELKSPFARPTLVCFLRDGSLAAVNDSGRTAKLWSIRNGDVLTLYGDGSDMLSIQMVKQQPFIAVATTDDLVSIYHAGNGARVRKLLTPSKIRMMTVHAEKPIIAVSDGRRRIRLFYYEEKAGRYGKKMGWWKSYDLSGVNGVMDGDVLDIAFNVKNNMLVAVLANGKIVYCGERDCHYSSSFNIITAFNVQAYDFSNVLCTPELQEQLRRNGA